MKSKVPETENKGLKKTEIKQRGDEVKKGKL